MDDLAMTMPVGMDLIPTSGPLGTTSTLRRTGTQTGGTLMGTGGGGGQVMATSQPLDYGSLTTGATTAGPGDAMRRKQIQDLKTDLDLLRAKLGRRNALLKEFVKAYHHDVITVKEELVRKEAAGSEKKFIVSTEVRDHIPSADLREFLKLFAPTECYTRVKACETCGGTIDIVHHESERVVELDKKCKELQDRADEAEQLITGHRVEALRDRKILEEERFRMSLDRQIFEDRVLELKAELAKYDPKEIAQLRRDVVLYRTQTKEQSVKLKAMNTLEADLRKMTADYEALQEQLLEKDSLLREIERDKSTTEELAASLGRKCESMEQELERSAASVQDAQRKCKAATDQMNQLKESNSKLQKVLQDSRRTEQAARTRLQEVEAQLQEVAKQNSELQLQLTKAQSKLEERVDEFAVIREEIKERRKSQVNLPSIQVFAAQLDQFGDALELRSLPSRAANLMAGGGGGGAASPSSTGSQKPPGDESAQMFVVDLADALPVMRKPSARMMAPQQQQAHDDDDSSSTSSSSSSSSSSSLTTRKSSTSAPQQQPAGKQQQHDKPARKSSSHRHQSHDGDNSSQGDESHMAISSVGSGVSGGSETRLQDGGGSKMEIWIEVSSSSSSSDDSASEAGSSIRTGIDSVISRKIAMASSDGSERTALKEEVERLLERVKQLEAELSEEKTTRALIERNFIRATSRRFFDIKVQDDFLLLPTEEEEEGEEDEEDDEELGGTEGGVVASLKGSEVEGSQAAPSGSKRDSGGSSTKRGSGGSTKRGSGGSSTKRDSANSSTKSVALSEGGGSSSSSASVLASAKEMKEEFVQVVQSLLEKHRTMAIAGGATMTTRGGMGETGGAGAATAALSVSELDMHNLTEENETLVAKLVRAVREKELAQEALAKVSHGDKQVRKTQRNAPTAGTQVIKTVEVDTKEVNSLREQVSQLETKYHEAKIKHEEKVKHMEEKLQKSRSQLVEEKMKLSKATEEVDQLRVDQQILEDRLCREEAKVATLREGLKDQLEQISRLEVQKNEQAIELNFKIARKEDEVEAQKQEVATQAAKREQVKTAAANLLSCMFRVAKGMEEALERRVPASNLRGIDPKALSDPATKFIARRFDKRESLKDDEMPLGLNTARTLEYPLLYMSARLTWTLENLTNEVTHHKQVKKDLNAKVDADAKAIAKLEKRVKELLKTIEDLKEVQIRRLEAKDAEISELKCTIIQMMQKENDMEVEIARLRVIERTCESLKKATAEAQEQRDAAELDAKKARAQLAEYKVVYDQMVRTVEECQAKMAQCVADYNDVCRVLAETRETLAQTEKKLEHAQEIIRQDELRRMAMVSVATQFNPEITESETQTTFLVPDMNLRHSIALDDGSRASKLFVERCVTPSILGPSVPRRCSTAVGTSVITTGGRGETQPEDDVVWHEMEGLGLRTPVKSFTTGMARVLSCAQPVGSLRRDMTDFMRPVHHKKPIPQRTARTLSPIHLT